MQSPVPPNNTQIKTFDDAVNAINAILRYLLSLAPWLDSLHLTGLQGTPMNQAQLDAMTSNNDLVQAGKFFHNTDTGLMNKAEVVAGVLRISTVA